VGFPKACPRPRTLLARAATIFGRIGYGGPCPHRYVFSLHALDAPLNLAGSPGAPDVRAAMEGHVLAEAQLTARYSRGG
jgi:phosphatidylethanolamine-binding protein (PEBP) family uncharacterized protein